MYRRHVGIDSIEGPGKVVVVGAGGDKLESFASFESFESLFPNADEG